MSSWYVVLTGTQQELTTVWRLHYLGLEMFTPVIRRRVRTGRIHRGRFVTRVVARPMFPSYGFIRENEVRDIDEIRSVGGVRGFLCNARNEFVMLPHEAVLAIYSKQQETLCEFIEASRNRRRFASTLHLGQLVRVEDGGVYSGLVAPVDHIDARGRVEVLLGMIRHTLPAEMVAPA
jgi:transcription antitermination factor NusG